MGRNFRLFDLNFAGKMEWEEAPPVAKSNVSIIPYTTTASSKDFVNATPTKSDLQAGFDAKIAVTPSLNLDLTVNPDFAQVEVDRQVTNLSRFELFFPERRQFFLENSDLFGSFGFSNINPFFSRRIGLGRNVNNGQNVRVPILAGARLSGRLNKDWRVGLLNVQTGKSDEFGLPATNFTVAALQRRIGLRNNLGFIFANKEELNNKASLGRFNRVLGMDFNLASPNAVWTGKTFYHRLFRPENTSGQYAMGASVFYNRPWINVDVNAENVGENYQAEMGFVPRRGYWRNSATLDRIFFPKGRASQTINNFRIGPDYDVLYSTIDQRVTDWDAGIFFRIAFQNSAEINGALARWDYTYLFSPFDPTNSGGLELPAGKEYTYFSNRLGFRTNQRKNFFVNSNFRWGAYFNGKIRQAQMGFNYRLQPYGIFSLEATYTRIQLPQPFNSADLWLIGPRAELAFTKSIFFNLFLQYNNQVNNFNVNARFQWRFKPASDFFLVYTDNYFATADDTQMVGGRPIQAFQPKNRALVAKLTYWFNL
ncbi:MAG: hydrolase [Sphingobacteriia bacterium]|nr:MAG: hydrolase [Sphingobacteriia bacterium]